MLDTNSCTNNKIACGSETAKRLEQEANLMIGTDDKEQTSAMLRTLTPREEQIVRMRYGFDDGIECTLEEMGQRLSMTPERIRQIQDQALRKLRYLSLGEELPSRPS